MGLIIACDGGEVTASYLVNNSIKPDKFIFTLHDLKATLQYLNPQVDSVLMIVRGMTEWSNSITIMMCNMLQDYQKEAGMPLDYEILSNMPLAIKQTYTFYQDDLLYGTEELMRWDADNERFKTVPIKRREDKAITKYIGVNAAKTIYVPFERTGVETTRLSVDEQKLLERRIDLFKF